jgi:hypothetical protein
MDFAINKETHSCYTFFISRESKEIPRYFFTSSSFPWNNSLSRTSSQVQR